jgi:hypothetical protein
LPRAMLRENLPCIPGLLGLRYLRFRLPLERRASGLPLQD